MTYYLHTEAGEKSNGTTYDSPEEMLEIVRGIFGPSCDFGITEGTILDGDYELIATFGTYELEAK